MSPWWKALLVLLCVACSRGKAPSSDPGPVRSAPATSAAPSARLGANDQNEAPSIHERRTERERLVQEAIEAEGITNPRVLAALRKVPRHLFVPEEMRGFAYEDRPLPIGFGQTISQPYIVAAMSQAAKLEPTDRCLEIGTGSGYQAAVLAELCKEVYSIEYIPGVAEFGAANLRNAGYDVQLRTGDGYLGWPEAAPFDAIVVTAAPERVPQPLLDQLALGGRLVIPVGPEGSVQTLELWTRVAEGSGAEAFERRAIADVRFVPFLGDRAAQERDD